MTHTNMASDGLTAGEREASDPTRADPMHVDPRHAGTMFALTAAAAAQAHPRVREWYGAARLLANLVSALQEPVGWIDDEGFGTGYRDGVAVIDIPDPMAWANRRLILRDGAWAVTGIRFRQRDLAKPFVEMIGSSLAAPTMSSRSNDAVRTGISAENAAWQRMADAIWTVYAPFRLCKLQVFVADPDDAVSAFTQLGWRAEIDMYLVAGLISDLRTRARSTRFDDMTLTAISAEQASEFATNAYAALAEQKPASALWAQPQSIEEFTDYGSAGLLFGIIIDGHLAGAVAAARRARHGLAGFSVEEIVLDADHRGQRLAGAVLQHLVDRLPAEQGDVLWGTIHPDNHASLRNGLGVGREIVGANLWVTPSGWPGWGQAN